MNTNQQHIDNGGTQCPYCNSQDITGEDIHIEAGAAWQEVSCNDCGQEWQDTYTLTGYASANK